MKNFSLKRQLRQAGASRQEARDLSAITAELQDSLPHLDGSVKQQIAEQIGFNQKPSYVRPRFALAGAFVALILLSVAAQFAQPGSPLYALKQATQEVRVILQPSFKAELQQQRADEQRKVNEQQNSEDTRSKESGSNSGSSSPSDDTLLKVNKSASGSGKIEDVKIDSSGSGSVEVKIPEVKIDNSGKSIDNSGPGSSNDSKSGDELKL